MPVTRRVATLLLTTMWMRERDALDITMRRISGGFHPPSVMADARHQLTSISSIVKALDTMVEKPMDEVVAQDYWDLKKRVSVIAKKS